MVPWLVATQLQASHGIFSLCTPTSPHGIVKSEDTSVNGLDAYTALVGP
jgi:hypothetical protein